MLGSKFTLVIPTFNRPAELARLVAYLGRERAGFPVLVLDSSTPDAQKQNAAAIASAGLSAQHVAFDSAMPPWEKFWRGAELVQTDYCAFCADDDLVLVASLAPLIEFLEAHPDYSMAHGWYFSFYETGQFGITATVYRGASIDESDALARLHTLFGRYEALTYGLHRTRVMRDLMRSVQGVRSMLGRELLGGALAVVAGKAARLPLFYYGRSLGPSQFYSGWHPLEMLLGRPDDLYQDYLAYRELIACSLGDSGYSPQALTTILDLIHFRYLSDYVKPPVMDYLVAQVMARRPKAEVIQGMWPVLAGSGGGGVLARLRRNALLRRLRRLVVPDPIVSRLKRVMGRGMKSVRAAGPDGAAREYLLYEGFLKALPSAAAPGGQVTGLLRALNSY